MNGKTSIEQLLRWRLTQAEATAPPVPRAALLLDMARPWWDRLPEQFQNFARQLDRIHIAVGHAMAEPHVSGPGYPVPVLVIHVAEKLETSARVLYLTVHDGRLRLRFRLNAAIPMPLESFEVTFVDSGLHPLFSANATSSVAGEHRLDIELPGQLASDWEKLKVTDRMPFRFIVRLDNDKA
jgi:hypothetical protein